MGRDRSTRCITLAASANPQASADGNEDVLPQLVRFEVSPQAARKAFIRWQRQSILAPRNALSEGSWTSRAVYLPFWSFSGSASVHYTATVTQPSGFTTCEHWSRPSALTFGTGTPQSLVYSSYRYRRDYMEQLKRPDWKSGAVRLPWATALDPGDALGGPKLEVDPPDMRQSIAWQLAIQGLTDQQEEEGKLDIAQRLKEGVVLKHVRVQLSFHTRNAELLFLPAHVIEYAWGEAFNVHSERVPDKYMAVVAGSGEPVRVAGQQHYSRPRAVMAAAAAAAGVGAGLAVLTGAEGGWLWPLTIEGAFSWIIAGAAAGVATRLVPAIVERKAEDLRASVEDAELDRALGFGIGPAATGSDEQEELLARTEWRRWEAVDRRGWEGNKRRAWAEDLLAAQTRRRVQRRAVASRMAAEGARAAQDEERERRRFKRYGPSRHQEHAYSRHQQFASGLRGAGKADFLGLYAVLGLEVGNRSVTEEDIKRAFRRAALKSHPDRHHHHQGRGMSSQQARERFQKVRAAYEVLRDPKRRAQYDAGQRPE